MTEFLPDIGVLTLWLINHGSLVLLILLSLGILALPIPEETLMVVAGVLMHKGKLPMAPTVLCAYAGTIAGITMSYLLGRSLGSFLVHKYGRWVGITLERLEKAHSWFQRFGGWLLIFGYFIPGVRHLTGLSAGTSEMRYRDCALYAYLGAILWASFFLAFGYFAGNYFFDVVSHLEEADLIIIVLAVAFLLVMAALVLRRIKKRL